MMIKIIMMMMMMIMIIIIIIITMIILIMIIIIVIIMIIIIVIILIIIIVIIFHMSAFFIQSLSILLYFEITSICYRGTEQMFSTIQTKIANLHNELPKLRSKQ